MGKDELDAGPFTRLVNDLVGSGFTIMGHTLEENFGDSLLLLRGGATRLRVVRDRSQWFLEIAGPDSEDWFGPVVWLAMLEDKFPPAGLMATDHQVEFVRDRRAALEQASAGESGDVLGRLRSWQARVAASRRTLPAEF